MEELSRKRVDESWKEQAEREKRGSGPSGAPSGGPAPAEPRAPAREGSAEGPQAQFDLFISGLTAEALVAMGEMPHPTTRRQAVNLPQAKYVIDVLGVLEEKTRGNLTVEEERLLKDALYQLRMRYLAKAGGSEQLSKRP